MSFPLGTAEQGGGAVVAPDVAILDTLANTGAVSDSADAGSFTCSAGSNRLLISIQHMTGSEPDPIPNTTYGGQAMTLQANGASSGFPARVQIWTLDEAGIAAASDDEFNEVERSSTYRATAVCLQNVHQTTPVIDNDDSNGNPLADLTLTTEAGGYIVAGLMHDYSSDDGVTWASPLTERVDIDTGSQVAGAADALTTGASTVASVSTVETPNQRALAAISIRKA